MHFLSTKVRVLVPLLIVPASTISISRLLDSVHNVSRQRSWKQADIANSRRLPKIPQQTKQTRKEQPIHANTPEPQKVVCTRLEEVMAAHKILAACTPEYTVIGKTKQRISFNVHLQAPEVEDDEAKRATVALSAVIDTLAPIPYFVDIVVCS